MNKQELLRELAQMIATGAVSREEVVNIVGSGNGLGSGAVTEAAQQKKHRHLSLTKILYGLGAVIVIIGIGFLIAQIWQDIGSVGRVTVTLGLGLILSISGSLLLNTKPDHSIGKIFHAIGGVVMPGGAVVLLTEMFEYDVSLWSFASAFGVLFIFYIVLMFIHKKEVLTFFALANGTAAIYLVVAAILDANFTSYAGDIFAYLTMVVGIIYLLLAYGFRSGWNKRLVPSLYFLGSAGFFVAAFTRVFDSGIWEILFFLLALGGVVLAVYLRSKAILVISTLALVGHIIYITGEYFADSLGWPISLVILGFVIIGLGYGSVTLNKRFISRVMVD